MSIWIRLQSLRKFYTSQGFPQRFRGRGDSLWHIWFSILLGTVLHWTNRLNPNKFSKKLWLCFWKCTMQVKFLLKFFQKLETFFSWYVLPNYGRGRKGEHEGKWYTWFFGGGRYDRMVGSFENLIMCPPTPCPFFNGKPWSYILNLVLTIKFSFRNVHDEIWWHGIRFYSMPSIFSSRQSHSLNVWKAPFI